MKSEPDNDPELEQQRTEIETAFRERWMLVDLSKPRILTERAYAEARKIISQRGWTWLDQAIIDGVRAGAQPGDALPPLHPDRFRGHITDAEAIIIGGGPGQRVAVLFPLDDFPGARFGHRFKPGPFNASQEAAQLMDDIKAGAVHRMMDTNPPSGDSPGIVWTTWGTPSTDSELQRQHTMIEAAFRHGWTPIGAGEPRVLTERDYTEVRAILGRGGWTGLDQATIDAVRGGAQPGDSLPPLQALPYIDRVTDTEVILTGTGPGQRVTVLFSHTDFPGARFGHRFPLDPFGKDYESIWLKEEVETGALNRMMRNQPPADSTGTIWTTWGSPPQ